jgi:taurine dioxygenase
MSAPESRALIDYLVGVAAEPEYTCRYRWSPGVVGIWDNLATMHYGVNDFSEPRVFHRVMIQGPELPANAGRWAALDDDAPRTMVTKDGSVGVAGQFTTELWSRDN